MPDTLGEAIVARATKAADPQVELERLAAQFVPSPQAEYELRRRGDARPDNLVAALYADRRRAAIKLGRFAPEEDSQP